MSLFGAKPAPAFFKKDFRAVMTSRMTDNVIFDLDGTLLDTLADLAASVNHALRLNSLPPRSTAEVRAFLGNGARALVTRAVGGRAEGDDLERVLADFRSHYLAHCLDTTRPYPGVAELLERLRADGLGTAIVSNKPHAAVAELHRHFFATLVRTAVGEGGEVRRKPDPSGVLAAVRLLGGKPETAVYVGDSEVDFETARRAGMRCVLVSWGFRDEVFLRTLPLDGTPVISSPAQLLPLL